MAGFPIAELLEPLADNRGLTPIMALRDSAGRINPAIDAGTNPDGILYDQRGAPFARASGNGVDIGTFERQLPIPEPSSQTLVFIGLLTLCILPSAKRETGIHQLRAILGALADGLIRCGG